MRVGIVTIADFNNYGNRLQNYALQQVIKSFGMDCVSYVSFKPKYVKYLIKTLLEKDDRNLFSKRMDIVRMKNFLHFDQKYVHSIETRNMQFPESLGTECDYFVAGSDQIWNPLWSQALYHNTFLQFVPENKRIAFAPSFGTEDIPKELVEKYKKGLNEFFALSVREEVGQEIIKSLTGKDVDVLIDPTLLISAPEWDKILKKPNGMRENEQYLLEYFLGDLSPKQNKEFEVISSKYNFKRIKLLDKDQELFYTAGPSEFLYLIKNANLIVTDSFHASVFSFIFNKPFLVYSRKGVMNGMTSRIETLLAKCIMVS